MTPQEQTDAQHLKLLSIFHYVLAGFYLLGILFLFFHYFMMKSIMTMAENAPTNPGDPPPPDMEHFMSIFIWFYIGMGLFMGILIIGNVLAGNFLRKRTHRVFTFVVAGINCLNMPLGTALGVFTFIVLLRESVAASYKART